MAKNVSYRASELSPEMRRAAEVLLSQTLNDDETVSVRVTRSPEEASFRQLLNQVDSLAKRVESVPEAEVDAAIDEAVDYVRHHRT